MALFIQENTKQLEPSSYLQYTKEKIEEEGKRGGMLGFIKTHVLGRDNMYS